MKSLLLIILFASGTCYAAKISGSIYKVDRPDHPHENTLLLVDDGSVIKLKPGFNADALSKPFPGQNYSFTVDDDGYLLSFSSYSKKMSHEKSRIKGQLESTFDPTVLTSPNEIERILKSFKRKYKKDSQCYNRSHVWSFDTREQFGVSTMKVFLFFTRSYIREFNYKWWFHNAPMVYFYNSGQNKEIVLDPEFSSRPLEVRDWTNLFMKNQSHCREVSKYTEYELNQESQYCYVLKESMFYYQPIDLERLDKQGYKKTNWIDWEIKNAFLQGFGIQ